MKLAKFKKISYPIYCVTKQEAETLFNEGIVIYIQTSDTDLKPESCNTFMLAANVWDASLNIYKQGLTPLQYGFDNIVNWINERINNVPAFFTFNSKQFLIIDNN